MPQRCPASLLGLFLALALSGAEPPAALANGQTTHIWITEAALSALPDGELKELLARPELRDPLINGAMFPDGGYAVGDDYGELAHWEPFQQSYLQWIRDTYAAPYTEGEAADHVAFFMGMASHGMADEVFDSLFMERSRIYDPGWETNETNLDTASDVLWAAEVGPIQAPELWLPTTPIVDLFTEELSYEVATETVEQGQNLLFTALAFTEWARTDEERLAFFGAEFPWTAEYLSDTTVPGSPPREALVVAAYWEEQWARLHDPSSWTDPIVDFVPGAGSFGLWTDSTAVESRLLLTFGRGVDAAGFSAVSVEEADGPEVPVSVQHHYGNFSHCVHVWPQQDWETNTDYRIAIDGSLLNEDGTAFEGIWEANFSTKAPPQEPVSPTEQVAGAASGCSCRLLVGTISAEGSPRRGPAWLLLFLSSLWVRARRPR